ncbi:gremlin-1-like [Oppia nitens]|uniref:gremlin-1-like n=1 Tax=Oppia nitens TaxID=1686743 RepID=UPI0023DCA462|nr:gremlin-1-like [Oppia nitens]
MRPKSVAYSGLQSYCCQTVTTLCLLSLLVVTICSLPTRDHKNHQTRQRKTQQNSLQRSAFLALRSSLGPAIGRVPNMRRNFCQTVPYKQKIQEPGCISRTILNAYCYGSCNSFFIPANGNDSLPFSSCAFCLPRRYRWQTVRLKCPDSVPAIKRKKVQIVSKCRCQTETL